ncbi:MAG: esterase-like activity of phytase family protein [Alphaproteobacteria bacterium]|nr:esterase-like activity of phytase family protein [Alphaproteobacteria bacterium]
MPALTLPNGKPANYTIGIGSGAFRHPSDPDNVIWTIGDRGPNMTCGEAGKLLGSDIAETCKKQKRGRVYPQPGYTPSIYKIELDRAAGTFKVLDIIPVKTAKTGRPITGLLNPQTVATRDTGMNLRGDVLPYDPDNLDLEGIVRLADGAFWIGEEMGPSIAQISADGRLLKRIVPANAAEDYKGSEAQVIPALPAVLSRRQGNRGIESLAMSPDEKFLYFIMQNPLANPDAKTYSQAKNTRVFKFEIATSKLVGQWVYQLDDPQSFALDPSNRQSDPRISEMMALGTDRLLVLERTEGTTKLHEIVLEGATDILGTKWDDVATSPSLEVQNDLTGTGITPVKKTLRFDTARDFKSAPTKLEGLALLGDGSLAIINDNDFGIRGDVTKVLIVKGAVQADPALWKRK